jgi:hypothetical protein
LKRAEYGVLWLLVRDGRREGTMEWYDRVKKWRNAIVGLALLSALGLLATSLPPASAQPTSCPAWSVVASANAETNENVLEAVSGVSANDIWAVGYSVTGGVARTLAQHWDGRAWTTVPSPNPNSGGNYLDDVVAISANNVWAVGDSGTSTNPGTIILHWDGSTWTAAPLPALEPSGNSLYSISAVSANDIWAVGVVGNVNTRSQGLTMHYNGVDWRVVPNPSLSSVEILYGVSARTSNDAWAVGASASDRGIQTRVKRWDGTQWTTLEKPPIGSARRNELWAVVAVAPNDVWAVGGQSAGGSTTIIEHWGETGWTRVDSPNIAAINTLLSVTALSADDIWAVGYGETARVQQPMIVRWNGTGWAAVAAPQVEGNGVLNGINKLPGGELIAVGSAGPEGSRRTLVMRYTNPCAAPTSTPTIAPVPAIGTGTPTAAPTFAPTPLPGSGSRTFPETGKSVSGLFLDYWDRNGGLPQQGFPISEMFTEVSDLNGKPYTVQYFERAVFEYHPENQAPFNVLLSQLGTFQFKKKYPQGAPGQTPNTSPGSVLFPETGKRLGGKFLTYWREHGGLPQQGFPISDEFTEVSDLNGKTYTVQYFERAVFEDHPENQPPYDVLLSQLGTFQHRAKHGGR